MEFSTINESDLHSTLKNMYAEIYDGKTEICQNGYVYDIIASDNTVIEIQTKNLSQLKNKLEDTIKRNQKIKLVHPVIINKRIITYDNDGKVLSNRKSPKKGNFYDIFKELTQIYPLLLNENLSLEILEINMTEVRIKDLELVQSANKKRRFKKDWIKSNKKLDEILNTKILNSKEDFLSLLPKELPDLFCAKDINKAINSKNGNLLIWIFVRMGLIKYISKKGNTKFYKVN